MKHTCFLKTLCVLFVLCFAFGGTAFSAPIENSASTQAAAENAGVLPGLNMLTGTDKPYGFETAEEADAFAGVLTANCMNGTAAVADNPEKDAVNGSNKVLHMTSTLPDKNDAYPSLVYSLPQKSEAERPVYVSFMYKKTYTPEAGEACPDAANIWVMKGGSIAATPEAYLVDKPWKQFSSLVDFAKATIPGTSTVDPADVTDISLQWKILKSAGTTNYWLDEVLYIPSYKATYFANDGTEEVIATEYFLFDENGRIRSDYAVNQAYNAKRFGYFFKGWATTPSGEAVTAVNLHHEDVALYAVWEKDPELPEPTTYLWDFEEASSQVWLAANEGCSVTYKNGMLLATAAENADDAYLYHPALSLDTKSHRYLIVKARSRGNVDSILFTFTTSDTSGTEESRTVALPLDTNADVFREYSVFLSSNDCWTGSYQTCMLRLTGSGTLEIEEIRLATFYEASADVPASEYHYSAAQYNAWGNTSKTVNPDGTVTITRAGDSAQGALDLTAPAKPLHTGIYNKLVIKAKTGSVIPGFCVYYSTISHPGYSGDKTVDTQTLSVSDSEYTYFVADMSEEPLYDGNAATFMIAAKGIGSAVIADVFLCDKVEFAEQKKIEKLRLYTTATEITENNGQVTVYPYVRYADGTEITHAVFVTDTVNAKLDHNEDGSLTLTGMMNGSITVTAMIDGVEEPLSTTVVISGQPERMAVNDYKLLIFGNSIANHASAPSIGWNRDCGMAATSPEKDYVHRLQFYMNEKFGAMSTSVEFGTSIAAFERAIPKNDITKDYMDMIPVYVKDVTTAKPDIISIQMGENVSSGPTSETYKHAVKCLVKAFRQAAPNAVIVVSTPFWGGYEKVVGMTEAAGELNVGLALVHTLNSRENMAWDDASLKDAIDGVKNHPGDLGMDRIAKLIFEQVNARLTLKDRTEYTTIPQNIMFADGTVTEIKEADASVQLSANVIPATAPQAVTWAVSDKNLATITADGVLTAKNDGVVTVTVTSKYDASLSASLDIAISGQTTPFTVTYDKNTEDTVTELPEPNRFAKNTFVFDDGYPVRETYKFLGWALTPTGEPVKSIEITGDVTVYAQWEIAKSWSFDTDGYKENFTIDNGFNQYVLDGKFMSIATDTNVATGEVLKVNSPKLNLNASDYYALIITMQNTEIASDTVLDMTIHTTGGDVKFREKVVTRDYTTYCFKLSKVSGTITGFEFTPTNVDCTINLDEIAFVTQPFIAYDSSASIRAAAPIGVRFRAGIANKLLVSSVRKDGFAVKEYGFLVSIGSRINASESLTLEAVKDGNAIKGVAYDEKTNILYSTTEDARIIAAVLLGVPDTKDVYTMDLFVRSYVVLSNGIVLYGQPVTDTMYDIALRVMETMTGKEPYAAFIYHIIEISEMT